MLIPPVRLSRINFRFPNYGSTFGKSLWENAFAKLAVKH
jgi:hypothetical protein